LLAIGFANASRFALVYRYTYRYNFAKCRRYYLHKGNATKTANMLLQRQANVCFNCLRRVSPQ
jgi:hypothetical protein